MRAVEARVEVPSSRDSSSSEKTQHATALRPKAAALEERATLPATISTALRIGRMMMAPKCALTRHVTPSSSFRAEFDLLHVSKCRQRFRQRISRPDRDDSQSIGMQMFLGHREDILLGQLDHLCAQLLEKVLR